MLSNRAYQGSCPTSHSGDAHVTIPCDRPGPAGDSHFQSLRASHVLATLRSWRWITPPISCLGNAITPAAALVEEPTGRTIAPARFRDSRRLRYGGRRRGSDAAGVRSTEPSDSRSPQRPKTCALSGQPDGKSVVFFKEIPQCLETPGRSRGFWGQDASERPQVCSRDNVLFAGLLVRSSPLGGEARRRRSSRVVS